MQPQQSIPNQYDWINPVHNRKLFAGRKEELSKIMDELIRVKGEESITPIITITGVRRIGKTSLLLRIEEKCKDYLLKSIIIPIEEGRLQNSWEFWDEIFSGLLLSAQKEGADISVKRMGTMGFTSEQPKSKSSHPPAIDDLLFPSACRLYLSGAQTELPSYIIQNDFEIIVKLFRRLGYEGLILIFDERDMGVAS